MTNSLKAISPKALRVFKVLINGLVEVGIDRKFNNSDVFLPVTIELIRCEPGKFLLYSVAHYILVNDDLVCDPEVIFALTSEGDVYAISFENTMGLSQPVRILQDQLIVSDGPSQRDLASFANMFLANIAEQQGIGK